ncbi:hypothetical protein CEE39_05340 [bacterium (candidate division B38) B3_B38]|nr:MAG: hypothetical protein CEE39_05340 [bacterium (candidate division B38) B3_B38]
MPEFTIMSFNIEHMNLMFEDNVIKPNEQQRARKIARVIQDINPHVLGICEAANSPDEHNHFLNNYLPGSGYQLAHGVSRGSQNLVFYYRQPFSVVSIDDALSRYEPWEADIEADGLKERLKWDRKPLEAVAEIGSGGPRLRIILVHTKSKGIFSVVDLHDFQKISLANRKRLVGQALKLRNRLDQLLEEPNPLPTIVMGDMNDGPGLDPFEKMIGRSFVETVMGSVYNPGKIFHNALWWMTKESGLKKQLWTADFPDPIVSHPLGYRHRVWIDHILVSPDMLRPANPVRYIMDSGKVGAKNRDSRQASDHFAVYCNIEID